MSVVIDLAPLKRYPQYRLLFIGQLVSLLGSNISAVAAPYLIYQLTQSSAKVGLLGAVSLVPMVLAGFWGGAVADVWNRRKIILICEGLLAVLCAAFALLVQFDMINEYGVLAMAAISSGLGGFHRPALESLTPRLVQKEDLPRVSSLNGFKGTFAHIIGPAIGGLLIAQGGVSFAFWIDALSFLLSAICLLGITNPLRDQAPGHRPGVRAIREGFLYAIQRPILLGTYVIDMIAMTFCYPVALFPAIAAMSGGATRLGPLYSAISVGALAATVLSAWTYKARRHGMMVILGALGWAVFVAAFGQALAINYWLAFVFLAAAGYCDMISATFRFTIWNETVPDSHRGRLAGIEMISYMSGPLIGNTLLGYMAAATTPATALKYGATASFCLVILATFFLWPFWMYVASERSKPQTS